MILLGSPCGDGIDGDKSGGGGIHDGKSGGDDIDDVRFSTEGARGALKRTR